MKLIIEGEDIQNLRHVLAAAKCRFYEGQRSTESDIARLWLQEKIDWIDNLQTKMVSIEKTERN